MVKKLTSRKGISPILATLLLIAIAVGAVVITYAWVITFTSTQTEQFGAVLSVENIRFYNVSTNEYVEVIIRNSGTADAKVVEVYAGTSSAALTQQSTVSYDPSTDGWANGMANAGSSLNITITMGWDAGTTYYFKVVTDAGQQLPFNKKA